jgi:hypothetical protein
MFTNVNLSAPLGAMALLGSGFLLVCFGIAFVYAITHRKFAFARGVLLVAAIMTATYLGLLLLFSFSSREKILALGDEKHFCELDCHLAYSVLDVQKAKTLGTAPNQTTTSGTFYVVTIKTRFDEDTISPRRGNGPLTPNSRVVTIVDQLGRTFSPSPVADRALAADGAPGTALTTPLQPGQSYMTRIVFDLPADVQNPTLLVREGEWLTHFVIGHENSPLHKKTAFQLGV